MNKIKGFSLSSPLLSTSSINNCAKTFFNNRTTDCIVQKRRVELEVKDRDLESEESMMDLYERWMRRYGKFRVYPLEKWTRFGIFMQTVKEHRSLNCFADGGVRERSRLIRCDGKHFYESAEGKRVRKKGRGFLY
ncbi:hypothetical protein MKW94_013199 [Papaver nudicaule]|uniref:Uncharacterized protein n=1 Tax=Papaver nudicaule TaxID=74823 RepID=A0AA41V6U9_PAPNU|nr:hypothetical protein [Papaver nudicaule]MCL7051496.1 hypothetical protein [Papaver nudicaule]